MKQFTDTEIKKLKELISEGVQVLDETTTLKDALKDTVKAVAEELDIKPAVLNKAINIAYKADFSKKSDEFNELEEILRATGRNY